MSINYTRHVAIFGFDDSSGVYSKDDQQIVLDVRFAGKIKIYYETIEELAARIAEHSTRIMTNEFGISALFLVNDKITAATMESLWEYDSELAEREVEARAMAGQDATELEEWLSKNPPRCYYSNDSHAGLCGDWSCYIEDKFGYGKSLVELLEQNGAIHDK